MQNKMRHLLNEVRMRRQVEESGRANIHTHGVSFQSEFYEQRPAVQMDMAVSICKLNANRVQTTKRTDTSGSRHQHQQHHKHKLEGKQTCQAKQEHEHGSSHLQPGVSKGTSTRTGTKAYYARPLRTANIFLTVQASGRVFAQRATFVLTIPAILTGRYPQLERGRSIKRTIPPTHPLTHLYATTAIWRNHHSNCNSSCVREDMLWTN